MRFLAFLLSIVFSMSVMAIDGIDQVQLRREFDEKVKANIREYLGPDVKFSTFVSVTFINEAAQVAATDAIDVGYIPLPAFPSQNYKDLTSKIDLIDVGIIFYSNLDEPTKKNIDVLIKQSLAPYKVKSAVSFVDAPIIPRKIDLAGTSVDEKSLKGLAIKNIPNIIELFGMLTLSLVLLLGFFLFAAAMKNPLLKIAESLKVEVKTRDGGFGGGISPRAKEDKAKSVSDTGKPTHFVLNTDEQERHIKVVVRTLKEKPQVFVNAIGRDQRDALGVKRLLPMLIIEDVPPLGDLLGHNTLARLEREGRGKPPMEDFDFDIWLKSFIERLTIGSIKKGNVLTRMISPAISDKLFSAEIDQLLNAAKSVDSGLAYKLVMDFLPPDAVENLIGELNANNKWNLLIEDQTIDLQSVEETAKNLVGFIDNIKTSAGVATPETTMQEVLLNPLLNYLKGRDLDASEQFISQIESVASGLAKELKKNIWTQRMLLLIPQDFLLSYVRDLDVEERFMFVWSLPQDISDYIFTMLPEGKAKTILSDRLMRSQRSERPEEFKMAQDFCREVLSDLQRLMVEGKFTLLEPEGERDDFIPDPDSLPSQSEIDEAGNDDIKRAA